MKQNIVLIKLHYPLFIVLFVLSGCIHKRQIDKQKLLIITKKPLSYTPKIIQNPPVTIWVHGTLMFRKPVYYHIFGDKPSLIPVMNLHNNHHFYTLAQAISENDPEQFPLHEFYIFNWSGKLQHQERKKAAKKLFEEIITLRKTYKERYGHVPVIQIITHSHGGNLVLNMASIKNIYTQFHIELLILLACPVQEKTMHYINNPLFKRIYSLYSGLDMIQILAPQIRRKNPHIKYKLPYRIPPFSSRLFPQYDHLIQAKIKVNNHSISHTHFSKQEFAALLPSIIEKLDSWNNGVKTTGNNCRYKLLCVYKK